MSEFRAEEAHHEGPDSGDTAPRVAIVAVHGVADQKPGESAAAMAELLLGLELPVASDGAATPLQYSTFEARTLHVPLRPTVLDHPERALVSAAKSVAPNPGPWTRLQCSLSERRGFTARMRHTPNPRALDAPGTLAHEFMRQQLAGYGGGDGGGTGEKSLCTTRLDGYATWRAGDPGATPSARLPRAQRTTIHIYEVFWADISRFGGGGLAFLGALYQLLFHLCTLGRQAVDDAALEHANERGWSLLSNLQAYAVRLLVLPIPILNLILLVTAFCALPARTITSRGTATAVAMATAGLIAIVLTYRAYVVAARLRVARRPLTWMAVPAIAALAGAGAAWGAISHAVPVEVVLAIEWWVVGAAAIGVLLWQYERVRPGARWVGILLLVATLGALIRSLGVAWQPDTTALAIVEDGSLWTMQLLFAALRASWMVVIVCAIAAFLLGCCLLAKAKRSGEVAQYARARAAVRTGRLALSLTVSLFLIVTILIWSGIFAASVKYLDIFKCGVTTTGPLMHALGWLVPTPKHMVRWLGEAVTTEFNEGCGLGPTDLTVYGYVRGLLVLSVGSGLPLMLLLFSAAFGLLIWMALPSVGMEGRDAAPSRCTNAQSQRWGAWLSRGLDSTSAVTCLLWTMSFAVPFVFALAEHGWLYIPWLVTMRKITVGMLSGMGAAVLASAVVVIGTISKVAGSGLDVALDVDNYLRTFPVDATPRARIAERYTSILRTIAAERDADGRPYDAVIIVAHSLGALISGDLLRFLKREAEAGAHDEALAPLGYSHGATPGQIPLYLFTMGNPVRQLLDRFFPHRYRWVRAEPDNGRQSLDELTPTRSIPPGAGPDAAELGVAAWRNAYRSGDYVGRSLWLDEWYNRTNGPDDSGGYPEPIYIASQGDVAEMCIGMGAHTHYWDKTAPDIALQIDKLVRGVLQ